jgi:propionyl-CoA carboxylase alpha chain
MNTRLQVEHPVTEMITGVDLVEQMLRAAYGEKLKIRQSDVKINGWAVESRVYAEDPYRNFLPSIGRLKRFLPPAEGALGPGTVRLDSGVREGDEISMFYDPMIAKLITHGKDRGAALDAHGLALDNFHIEGIQDNIPFIAAVIDEQRFRSGHITTAYIKDEFPQGFSGVSATAAQQAEMIAAAAYAHAFLTARAAAGSGRMTPPPEARKDWVVILGKDHHPVTIALDGAIAAISRSSGKTQRLETTWRPGDPIFRGTLDGKVIRVRIAPRPSGYRLRLRGVAEDAIVCAPHVADLYHRLPEKQKPDTSKLVISPMPGLVVSMDVAVGQKVEEGEAVCIVEAMKMQNIIRAGATGTVKSVLVKAGQSVAADEVMVEFA